MQAFFERFVRIAIAMILNMAILVVTITIIREFGEKYKISKDKKYITPIVLAGIIGMISTIIVYLVIM